MAYEIISIQPLDFTATNLTPAQMLDAPSPSFTSPNSIHLRPMDSAATTVNTSQLLDGTLTFVFLPNIISSFNTWYPEYGYCPPLPPPIIIHRGDANVPAGTTFSDPPGLHIGVYYRMPLSTTFTANGQV